MRQKLLLIPILVALALPATGTAAGSRLWRNCAVGLSLSAVFLAGGIAGRWTAPSGFDFGTSAGIEPEPGQAREQRWTVVERTTTLIYEIEGGSIVEHEITASGRALSRELPGTAGSRAVLPFRNEIVRLTDDHRVEIYNGWNRWLKVPIDTDVVELFVGPIGLYALGEDGVLYLALNTSLRPIDLSGEWPLLKGETFRFLSATDPGAVVDLEPVYPEASGAIAIMPDDVIATFRSGRRVAIGASIRRALQKDVRDLLDELMDQLEGNEGPAGERPRVPEGLELGPFILTSGG